MVIEKQLRNQNKKQTKTKKKRRNKKDISDTKRE